MLLQITEVAHNGMQATWTTANIITIGAVLGGFIAQWIKMLINKTKMESRITQLEKDMDKSDEAHKAEIDAIIVAKTTIKQELKQDLADKNKIIHDRIDGLRNRTDEDRKENKKEFKEINGKLDSINTNVATLLARMK